ncbi:MAG: hypothetical protein H6739_11350 [Alphaproteobacteria bacterium]|nr:hypothetical protein [Alphaproteobacteria bacterium]
MSSDAFEVFEQMKSFLGFGDADVDNLRALGPVFAKHGTGITDRFYETLSKEPDTASFIEGRVDALKATHGAWMSELFAGDYGESYFDRRRRIGEAHVRIGLPPQFVEGVMSFIRVDGQAAILAEVPDRDEAVAKCGSLVKILDLDLIVINLAYADERIERLTKLTGMRRALIENIIKAGGKRK